MKKIVLIFLFLIVSLFSFGEIKLETSTNEPEVNQPFTIQVKFLNEDKKDYEIEGADKLEILSKGTRSNISIINGNRSSEKIDTYQVFTSELNPFSITVNLKDGKEKSNSITISPKEEGTASQSIGTDIGFQSNLKDGDTYYFGEKIPYEERFSTLVPISSLGYNKLPVFNDFSEKDITPIGSRGEYKQRYFTNSKGQKGQEILMKQGILQPNSSGEKSIITGRIGVSKSTGHDDFFFIQNEPPKYLGGKKINITILPLPNNAPAGFQGVVGKPKIEYSWNRDTINFGESVVLNVKISGEVNLDILEKITHNQYEDFNIFESIKNSDEKIIDGKYYAEKDFEIAFIPKKSGEVTIPQITIPYFDTESKSYKQLIIPNKSVKVIGNSKNISSEKNTPITPQISNLTENKVVPKKENREVEEIKISTIDDLRGEKKKDKFLIGGLITIIVLEGIIIGILLLKRKNKITTSNLKEIKEAKNIKELYEAYCKFMKEKFNFSPKVHLEDRLVKLGLSEEFIELNRELENAYYKNIEVDKKEVLRKIKKELKNEK